jgi:protein tyrosine phosphatase
VTVEHGGKTVVGTFNVIKTPPSTASGYILNEHTNERVLLMADSRELRFALQLKDESGSVFVRTTTINISVTLTGLSTALQSSCTSDDIGLCVGSVSLPLSWFMSSERSATVAYILNGQTHTLGQVTLASHFAVSAFSNQIVVELPSRSLYRGDVFTMDVYGNTENEILAFAVRLSTPLGLNIIGVATESRWATATVNGSLQLVGITGLLNENSNAVSSRPFKLLTVTVEVTSAAELGENSINCFVEELSDSVHGRVLLTGVNNVSGSALFFRSTATAFATQGAVNVISDHLIGLFAWVDVPQLVNTAKLDGLNVETEVLALTTRSSGRIVPPPGPLMCLNPQGIQVDSATNCRTLIVTRTQNADTGNVTVFISEGGVSAQSAISVRVWQPQSYTLTISDTSLSETRIGECSFGSQSGQLTAMANFSSGNLQATNVDVTDHMIPLTSTTNVQVTGRSVTLTGTLLTNQFIFYSNIFADGSLATTQIRQDNPVSIVAYMPVVVADMSASFPDITQSQLNGQGSISIRSKLESERDRATVEMVILYSDGQTHTIPSNNLTLRSLNTSVIEIEGNEIRPLRSGSGPLLEVTWSPSTACDSVVRVVEVTVELETPAMLVRSGDLTTAISPSNNAARFLSIPTSVPLTVLAEYRDGRREDITTSSFTLYTPSDGLIVNRNESSVEVSALPGTQSTSGTVSVTYGHDATGPVLSLTFDIVTVSSLGMEVGLFPIFPGSSRGSSFTLNTLSTDSVAWEQAALYISATLSDGQVLDVSDHELTTFTTSPIVFSVNISKQNGRPAVLTVQTGPTAPSIVNVSATFSDVTISEGASITVDTSSVIAQSFVAALMSDTLRGVAGTVISADSIRVNFTILATGHQYLDIVPSDYPTLLNITSGDAGTLSAASGNNLILRRNTLDPISVMVVLSTLRFSRTVRPHVNLDPDVGDVDIGSQTGPAVGELPVGSVRVVPVYVNTGTSPLGVIDITISYNTGLLDVDSIVGGSDWRDAIFDSSVEGGAIHLGGIVLSQNMSGTRLHLFSITFRVLPQSLPGTVDASISTRINIITEYGVAGTTIGQPTPRLSSAAGNVPYRILTVGRKKRSILQEADKLSGDVRQKRQTGEDCFLRGDANGDCSVDLGDVACIAVFLSEGLTNYSTTQGAAVQGKVSNPISKLDVNLNSVLDLNDPIYWFRVQFGLLPLVENFTITTVENPNSQCEFGISLSLVSLQGQPITQSKVFTDFSFESSLQTNSFLSSLAAGSVTPVLSRTSSPFGTIIELQSSSQNSGSFSISFPLNVTGNIDVSLLLGLRNASGIVQSVATIFGAITPAPKYAATSYTIEGFPISFPSGYNPLMSSNNLLSSTDCTSLNFADVALVFLSSTSASVLWSIVNLNPSVHSVQSITIFIRECPPGTNASPAPTAVVSDLCMERTENAVNLTSHVTTVKPYKDYQVQVRSQVSTANFVLGTSPEDVPVGVNTPLVTLSGDNATFTWPPPNITNGVIVMYRLTLNGQIVYTGAELSTSVVLGNIYADYFFFLDACTSVGCGRSQNGTLVGVVFITENVGPARISGGVIAAIIISAILSLLAVMLFLYTMRKWYRKVHKSKIDLTLLYHDFREEHVDVEFAPTLDDSLLPRDVQQEKLFESKFVMGDPRKFWYQEEQAIELTPFGYESDNYYEESDNEGNEYTGTPTMGRSVLENTNFYYDQPPADRDSSDDSDFWSTPVYDKTGKVIGKRKMSTAQWRKESSRTPSGKSEMKKSSSFVKSMFSRFGKHREEDEELLLEEDELGHNQEFEMITRKTSKKRASKTERDSKALAADLRRRVESGQTEREFARVSVHKPDMSTYAALLPDNTKKNRYRNALPVDNSRVCLHDVDITKPGADYINANFIDGVDGPRGYIAAQSPMASTVGDFWQMLWEQEVKEVVMASNVQPTGARTVARYWPEEGKTARYGRAVVTCVEEKSHDGFTEYTFDVSHGRSPEKRQLKQYHFEDWEDRGLPPNTSSLVSILKCLDEDSKSHSPAPVLVHCANGLGKTGAVIASHFALRAFAADETIDLPQIVKNLRRQRGQMVQSHEQYRFCCSAIADRLDPIAEEERDSEHKEGEVLVSKPPGLPQHLQSQGRPFSAPIDADSLTPRTQKRLRLQNMLPPPPPQTSRRGDKPAPSALQTTPPPPFSSPSDVSTPVKVSAVSSDTSFDSMMKPMISETSVSASKDGKLSTASSLDSLPTKDESVKPEASTTGKGDTDPHETIKTPSKSEEESVTVLEVNFSHVPLEEPGETSTPKEPEVAKTAPKDDPKKKKSGGLFAGPLSTGIQTISEPKSERRTPSSSKLNETKKPLERKKSIEPVKSSPPKDKPAEEKKETITSLGKKDEPKQSSGVSKDGSTEKKEVAKEDKPSSSPPPAEPVEEKPVGFEIEVEEPVGFEIGDGEPSPEPVRKEPEKKPTRGWKPPPKVDVPKEVKPTVVMPQEPPKIDFPRDTSPEEEWKPSRVNRLSMSRFQAFTKPITPAKSTPVKQPLPLKEETPVTPPKKDEPDGPARTEPSPQPTPESSDSKPTDVPQPDTKPFGKLSTSRWQPSSSSPPTSDDSGKPAWLQLIQQRKQERSGKPSDQSTPASSGKSIGSVDLSKFEGDKSKPQPLKPWQQKRDPTPAVKPEPEPQKSVPLSTKQEEKAPERDSDSAPKRVGKLDMSKFAAFK